MTSHFFLMLLLAAFVSLVFALLMRKNFQDQLYLGGKLFGASVIAAVLLGWLMYPWPL